MYKANKKFYCFFNKFDLRRSLLFRAQMTEGDEPLSWQEKKSPARVSFLSILRTLLKFIFIFIMGKDRQTSHVIWAKCLKRFDIKFNIKIDGEEKWQRAF